ncbi:serine/threonine protein kinase [Faecalicatena acetigenes]|uniref:Serine/threonine protein kinase n=1 Tax=Faecalicatena acetigenes TaxID=2981790 RepID=A0ABT2TDA3_9FIRM|nr:serine/threonine-protein kinase [Faecalicatena acetigenes]MCU6747699.1 serine/threonine protein kinase [Faecalicatena acetigenes]SCI04155.1 Serine/threonine-protein kinase PrkC [uncultured Clostridium sp.]
MYQWLLENLKKYYTFVKVLKKKESGEVLLYKHKQLENYVVVKKLIGFYPAYERLLGVKQEHLLLIYEVCRNEGETMILEEFIPGITIAERLEQETLSERYVKEIISQVCDGLYALHLNQIIHRDIKPENILVMKNREVKIMDFDAAKIYKMYSQKDTRTVGTIGYAAPEQYGEAQSDERTDIYGLGILMNVMLTGKHPVNEMAIGKIGNIIEKCIMVNPNKRYKHVMEVKEKLNKLRF